jgi:hypothetical protein
MRSADRTFKQAFALVAVVALLLSQPSVTSARGALRQNSFKVSSLGTAFGVQVEVEGTYTVNEHYVELSVDRAFIYVSEHCPYKGRRFVNTLVIGLATNNPSGRWEMENSSLPLSVERVLSPREEYSLAGLHFQIPRNAGTDLSQRWLVVVTEETAPDLPANERDEKGYAFAHSRRNIFADLGVEP